MIFYLEAKGQGEEILCQSGWQREVDSPFLGHRSLAEKTCLRRAFCCLRFLHSFWWQPALSSYLGNKGDLQVLGAHLELLIHICGRVYLRSIVCFPNFNDNCFSCSVPFYFIILLYFFILEITWNDK